MGNLFWLYIYVALGLIYCISTINELRGFLIDLSERPFEYFLGLLAFIIGWPFILYSNLQDRG